MIGPPGTRKPIAPDDTKGMAHRGDIELVADGDHLRRVVLDGILLARTSLEIATADLKATLVPTGSSGRAESIVRVLCALAGRGVEVRLLHGGEPSAPAMQHLARRLPAGMAFRRCPRLHAKAVIVDCRAMYLGSANLTGAGLGAKGDRRRNFEWGVWTTRTSLIDAVLDRFNDLWEGRHCAECGRRQVCAAPLEEPSSRARGRLRAAGGAG